MRKQKCVRTALAAAAVVLAALPALGQDSKPQPQPAPAQVKPPSSRGGLLGQRAALPNVLGRNRTLPIERHITLPGLPIGTPMPRPPMPAVVVGGPRVVTGSGLQVNGDYDGDKLDLHLHLGTGAGLIDDGRWYPPRGYAGRGYYYYNGRLYYSGGGYYSPGGYYYRPRYYYYSDEPVDGVLTERVDYTLRSPQTAQAPSEAVAPAPELTALEKAGLFMAADDLERAVRYYREHLDEDPEDVSAMRAMGVAMVEAGRVEDGVAVIAMAYRTDPLLARTALDLGAMGLDGRRYDSLLSRVLSFANKIDSGSAHLAGAVLLQADGKVAGANRVLDRAERAGLGAEVVDPMRRELGVPAQRG
ncbi:MAG: tetratricopeptide repeat protein [Phycisphaerales bacterium]|nr:tetratricopeptide repeat protein [Phycisphaerales bacterium]